MTVHVYREPVLGNKEEEVSVAPARPTTSAGARAGSARPRTGRARPPSARPAAPAIKKKREIAMEEQPRPVTAKVRFLGFFKLLNTNLNCGPKEQ